MVEGLDYSGIVEWAKTQDIPPYESMHNMVGSKAIAIDGKPATVGYIKPSGHAPGMGSVNYTPEIDVENPGGEDIILVEGRFSVRINNSSGMPKGSEVLKATPQRPRFLQLDGGDKITLHGANGPDDSTAWYVCYYPEVS